MKSVLAIAIPLIAVSLFLGLWLNRAELDLGDESEPLALKIEQASQEGVVFSIDEPEKEAERIQSLINYEALEYQLFLGRLAEDEGQVIRELSVLRNDEYREGAPMPVMRYDFDEIASLLTQHLQTKPALEALEALKPIDGNDQVAYPVYRSLVERYVLSEELFGLTKWIGYDGNHEYARLVAEDIGKYAAEFDIRRAADEYDRMQPSESRMAYMGAVYKAWIEKDVDASIDFIEMREPHRDLDMALYTLSNKYLFEDPAVAVDVAGSMMEPVLREVALDEALTHWKKVSPMEAELWVSDNPHLLSDDSR